MSPKHLKTQQGSVIQEGTESFSETVDISQSVKYFLKVIIHSLSWFPFIYMLIFLLKTLQ